MNYVFTIPIVAFGSISLVGIKATIWAFEQSKSNKILLIPTFILLLITLYPLSIVIHGLYSTIANNIIPRIIRFI